MTAFIIWMLMGAAFIGLGIYIWKSKKPAAFGFWANAKTFPVKDVKAYNTALGKLWCIYGTILILLGIPLLADDSPYIIITILGTVFATIAVMVIYITVIEKKYRK